MRFCHPSAVLAHEGKTPLWAAVARQRDGGPQRRFPRVAKTARGWQNLIPRVSKGAFNTGFTPTCVFKKRYGRHGMGCRPSLVSSRRGHGGSEAAGYDIVALLALDFFAPLFFDPRPRASNSSTCAEARRACPTKFGRSDSLQMISADVACPKVILCAHLALNPAKSPPSPHHSPRRPRTMEPPGAISRVRQLRPSFFVPSEIIFCVDLVQILGTKWV